MKEISSATGFLIDIKQIFYFIDIPVLLIIWHIIRKKEQKKDEMKESESRKSSWKKKTVGWIVSICLIAIIVYSPIDRAVAGVRSKYFSKTTQVAIGSVYGYHLYDIYAVLNKKSTTKYKTYDEMISDYNYLKNYNSNNFSKNEAMFGYAKR